MKNNHINPNMAFTLSNMASSLLSLEQKMALQWQYELSDLAALAKMVPSMAASARLGLSQSAMAQGFYGYALFLAQICANRPRFNSKPAPEMALELEPKLDLPKPRPYTHTPKLRPGY